ncbi:unnamed protein product [[Candida] boidinii]|uniref:Unnamed protein product n=1 Tax=Candida boidinii TaxID=5477 RepID=A0A9W6SXY0_CANBO|nr:hypothetical protein B5S30_g4093 [[Candida] boidinii]GME69508.1 unnamed protein product [[Candida] boidinii]GMF97902.1 unnamed protein product [[Candida] boidinii]
MTDVDKKLDINLVVEEVDPSNDIESNTSSTSNSLQNGGDESSNFDPVTGVKRGLKTRHLTLLALAGIIGPGSISGISNSLRMGGPSALFINYCFIGSIAFAVMQSVGELSTLYPSGSGFTEHANRFVDKAFSATISYNYIIIWIAVLANEYNVLCSTMTFWGPQIPLYGYFLIFWPFFMGFQFLGVGAYGELEYILAMVKIAGLTAFYIFTVIYMCGGVKGTPAFGFHTWNDPGAFADGFRGVAMVFTMVSTSYAGVEVTAIAAAETKNPAKAIPIAIRQTFWRILYVYVVLVLCFGIAVPYNDPGLKLSTGALKSPMTIAFQNAGWSNGYNLVNAFLLVICLSAISSSIYIGSRSIANLSNSGMLPKILAKTNKQGVPYYACVLMNLTGFISLMNISTGASNAFNYIVNISGVSTFIVWGGISFIHIRFRNGWVKAGRSVDDLPYKSPLFPYIPYYSVFMNTFLAFVQGWSYLKPFDASNFVDAYIMIPIFFIIFYGAKFYYKTQWVKYEEMDFDTGRRLDLEEMARLERIKEENENEEGNKFILTLKKIWHNVF